MSERPVIPPRAVTTPRLVTARETSSYLGYPLLIGDRDVVVSTPSGRRMGSVASVKQARLMVRGYRRVLREETSRARVVGDLADRRSASSTLCGDQVKETG